MKCLGRTDRCLMEREPIEIGLLTESDLPALADLHGQFWGEEQSLEIMQATYRRRRADPDYAFVVARQGGRLAGSVLGVFCDELYGQCRPFLLVEDLVVDESMRRAGVGGALLRELERLAAERDCSMILLMTEAEREDAVCFYQALGYECEPYRGFKKRLLRAASPPASC